MPHLYIPQTSLTQMGIESLPDKFKHPLIEAKILELGMDRALDWCAEVTAPFTPQIYYDELQGIADAAGIEYQV